MEKQIELDIARERRAKFLEEWLQFTGTKRKFAARYNITAERIGQILKKAMAEKLSGEKA